MTATNIVNLYFLTSVLLMEFSFFVRTLVGSNNMFKDNFRTTNSLET